MKDNFNNSSPVWVTLILFGLKDDPLKTKDLMDFGENMREKG